MVDEMDVKAGSERFATLADLTEGNKFEERFYPQLQAKIRFRTFIALDRLLYLQQKHQMLTGGRGVRDSQGFLAAVLKDVLVNPRIQTAEEERLLLKANATVLLDILGTVLGANEQSFQAVVEDLGEGSGPS